VDTAVVAAGIDEARGPRRADWYRAAHVDVRRATERQTPSPVVRDVSMARMAAHDAVIRADVRGPLEPWIHPSMKWIHNTTGRIFPDAMLERGGNSNGSMKPGREKSGRPTCRACEGRARV
jgi:hypothetical protein